jgi:hypothetical protein
MAAIPSRGEPTVIERPAPRDPAAGARKRLLAVAGMAVLVLAVGTFAALRGFHDLRPPLVHDARLLRGETRLDPLTSGDRVDASDIVHLEIDLAQDCSVYVLNRDERGAASLLFPVLGYVLQNPIEAGRDVSIPGTRTGEERPVAWTLGAVGGRMHLLVVASAAPIEGFEREAQRTSAHEPSAVALVHSLEGASAEELYRGVPGATIASPGNGTVDPAELVFETARQLAREFPDRVWVREFALESGE